MLRDLSDQVLRRGIKYSYYIIIIHCLMSDLDPYWAHADYSLYIYGEKTLYKKTL